MRHCGMVSGVGGVVGALLALCAVCSWVTCLFDRCLLCRRHHVYGQQLGGAFGFGSLVKMAPPPPRGGHIMVVRVNQPFSVTWSRGLLP